MLVPLINCDAEQEQRAGSSFLFYYIFIYYLCLEKQKDQIFLGISNNFCTVPNLPYRNEGAIYLKCLRMQNSGVRRN